MIITPDLQLSQELQELYLENKEYMSQLLFLEDEYRFFLQLFETRYTAIGEKHSEEELMFVGASLDELKSQMGKLKNLISKHQHLLETILKNEKQTIGFELIEENSIIAQTIATLLDSDKNIKKALFELVATK
ncbi:hypothetical protein FA048_01855 [Pedobacter polaris]|uniref:Uncharacterized protein n=1 Tax=Pedobacter polaris TaxID=2571273 RepID=A0A4U1CT85_9SPHI|nr:hypothetical protein [Pedobacter polaris]TKC12387.1 hypothetical protein FA048_01855 [Pedobacter polaris]